MFFVCVIPSFSPSKPKGYGLMSELGQTLDHLVSFEYDITVCISEIPTQCLEPRLQIYIAEFQDPTFLTSEKRIPIAYVDRQAS